MIDITPNDTSKPLCLSPQDTIPLTNINEANPHTVLTIIRKNKMSLLRFMILTFL